MSIQLTCPTGHTLKVADAWAGRTGRCPVCKAEVQVPALPPPPPQRNPPSLPSTTVVAAAAPVDLAVAQGTIIPQPPAPAPEMPTAVVAPAMPQPPPLPAPPTSASKDASHHAIDAVVAESPGYRPDADKRWTTYYLAAAGLALGLFCMAPAMPHLNLGNAPNWARAVLLLSVLQLAYAAWSASIPDWSTLRASMVLLTAIAAAYGLMMTVALTTSPQHTLPLDLTDVRRQAVLWCGCVMLLASLLAYFCGRAAWRWRRTLELLRA